MTVPGLSSGPVVLATGGTGGHVFPAEALAGELEARGVPFALVTDSRGRQWQGALARRPIHYIRSASPSGSVGSKIRAGPTLARRETRPWTRRWSRSFRIARRLVSPSSTGATGRSILRRTRWG